MTNTLQLSTLGPVTLEWALAEERNVVKWATYEPATENFIKDLWSQKDTLEKLIRYHMNLGMRYECNVLPPQNWIQGGFNICVFAEVSSIAGNKTSQIILRCPKPHKLAEDRYPGTIDEKMGCEVGAYAWVQDKCPEIRIPHLFGFGLSNGQHVSRTFPFLAPWHVLMSGSLPTQKICHCSPGSFDAAGASSTAFFDFRSFPNTSRAIQTAVLLQRTCCSNTLDRILAACSPIPSMLNGETWRKDSGCSKAFLESFSR